MFYAKQLPLQNENTIYRVCQKIERHFEYKNKIAYN